MTVLLARHGETEWNVAGRRQGRLDSPLTPRGRTNAMDIASAVKDHTVDLICSSPLGRAFETATLIADQVRAPVVVFDDLAEIDHGSFSGLTNAEIDLRFPGALLERAQQKYTWRFPGGESYADADRRSAVALRAIEDRGATTPLIVSHAMIARMLLRNLLDLDITSALARDLPHGVVLTTRSAPDPFGRGG